jgi:uncharacterized membrane protein YsdA (DUF1294 family)
MLRRVNRGGLTTLLKELAHDYFLLINIASFILMGVNKASAIRNESRIPEKWFFVLSMAGGPSGVFLGMVIFHHKTRKACFGFIAALALAIYFFILLSLIGL